MSEHQPILDELRQQTAAESSRKISAYILGFLQHENPGGLENGDDPNEGKN